MGFKNWIFEGELKITMLVQIIDAVISHPIVFVIRIQSAGSMEQSTIVVRDFSIGHRGITELCVIEKPQPQVGPHKRCRAKI